MEMGSNPTAPRLGGHAGALYSTTRRYLHGGVGEASVFVSSNRKEGHHRCE